LKKSGNSDAHNSEVVWLKNRVAELENQTDLVLLKSPVFGKAIFESIHDGISVLNPELTILQTNGLMREWYAENMPLEGKKCYEVYRNRKVPCNPCPTQRCLKSGKTERDIVPGLPGSALEWIELSCFPAVNSETGDVTVVVEFIRDITERKRIEDALRESEFRFRTLIQTAPVYFVTIDPEGRTVLMNEPMLEAIGYTQNEVVGKDYLNTFVPESERVELSAIFAKLHNENEQTLNRNHIVTRDGSELLVEWHGRPVYDDKGDFEYFFGVGLDITERSKAVVEKNRLEEQFRQVQKLESIGRLAGGIAHDLNNLLSPILGYGEMLLENADEDDARREPLEEIVAASIRARDLVSQLLAFSRRQTLKFVPVDLNTLLKQFSKLLRHAIGENIIIRLLLAESLPLIRGDTGQLEQIIMNLAVNARDAMPDGGELIIKTARVELDETFTSVHKYVIPGTHVMLAISDTGSGMDSATREHVFEPFFTTKDKGKGTGLGLSTVYGIVKQHNGYIWVYSEPGQGTTFKIYIPVSADFSEQITDPKKTSGNLRGTETILLVEDNEQVRNLAVSILTREGYHILAADSGKEALKLLDINKERVHLLLTDVVMAGMNGKQLFDQISRLHPKVRALYMSGFTDNVIIHNGVVNEGVNFIQKPFTVKALTSKVRETLDN